MAATAEAEKLRLLAEWQQAYERTDLVARLTVAALSDYRRNGEVLHLGPAIENQIDRYEQAVELEHAAHARYEDARGAA